MFHSGAGVGERGQRLRAGREGSMQVIGEKYRNVVNLPYS